MGRRLRTLVLVALMLGSAVPSTASARAHRDVEYRFDQVWNAAIRFLRVDHRFPIEERDDENGFVLFTYREYGRDHAASLEVVRTDVDGAERVRLVLHLEGMPTHAETALLEELERKLRADYGLPARPPQVAARGPSPLVPRLSERTPRSGETTGEGTAEAPTPSTAPEPPATDRRARSGSTPSTTDGTPDPATGPDPATAAAAARRSGRRP